MRLSRIAEERQAEWLALTQQEAGVAADNKPALNAIRYQKRSASEAYLLSELAAEGFLPGYGLPTGIVPLVTDSIACSRSARSRGRAREDSHARSRDYPSRQLDIALFEYAPGTTLVLDGLVYTSAGITLNWHGPASADGVREIQALRTAWRCRVCGAAGVTSTAVRPDACAMCGSSSLDCRDHIAPKGFAVDIRDKPNDDTVQVSHFPRHPPWVHASGGTWLALPDGGACAPALTALCTYRTAARRDTATRSVSNADGRQPKRSRRLQCGLCRRSFTIAAAIGPCEGRRKMSTASASARQAPFRLSAISNSVIRCAPRLWRSSSTVAAMQTLPEPSLSRCAKPAPSSSVSSPTRWDLPRPRRSRPNGPKLVRRRLRPGERRGGICLDHS